MQDYTAIFDFAAQAYEHVDCNLCNIPYGMPEQHQYVRDRYGYLTGVTQCCDLTYLNPRMTKEAYQAFYNGPYRALVSAFHGREINAQTIQAEQREYAKSLGDLLQPYLDRHMAQSLLDIGGSTGTIAAVIGSRFKISGTVIDPSEEELKVAAKSGLTTVLGTIEDFEPGRQYDLILLCQTVDHLLDIKGALEKIGKLLAPGGLFFVDIVDYDVTKEIKIDHPYSLTPKTMKAYLDKTGFKVLKEQRAEDEKHVGYVCEAA